MLFSEPKIPQTTPALRTPAPRAGFSALQRAENSSNQPSQHHLLLYFYGFSALQRAENSSNRLELIERALEVRFQCSSASRKFLKRRRHARVEKPQEVSVLFSEPKIPQSGVNPQPAVLYRCFSALQRAENSSNAARGA